MASRKKRGVRRGRSAAKRGGEIPVFGRPPKPITREIIDKMCQALRNAGTVEQAAIVADISPEHFFRWQAGARRRVKDGSASEEDGQFLRALTEAKQVRALELERTLHRHAKKHPTIALELAARLPETRERFRPPRVDVLVREEFQEAAERLRRAFLPGDPAGYEKAVAALAGEEPVQDEQESTPAPDSPLEARVEVEVAVQAGSPPPVGPEPAE